MKRSVYYLLLNNLAVFSASAQVIPGRYIVTLNGGASPQAVAAGHAIAADHIYTAALNGFAGAVPPGRLQALARDPRVAAIEPEQVVNLVQPLGNVRIQLHENAFETLTSGIDRIDADLNPRTDVSNVGIAIIDTGIDLTHPDLNVQNGKSFVKGAKTANDDHGHGTHVAGIAGAKTGDAKGVRGVAPNAVVWAVKVLNRNGSGSTAQVIGGVDWVTANAAAKGIKVANMSLGFQGTSSALNNAINNSIAAGVTYAVAAGNSAADAATFSPANHPLVITVSAIGDSDGRCGGLGPVTSDGADDRFASFSNFGSSVDIAAPGVDILSTYKGGQYASMSGTSMSSPHVAGAAAQAIASAAALGIVLTPAEVQAALIGDAAPQHRACDPATDGGNDLVSFDGGFGGFDGDPDHDHSSPSPLDEPMVYAKGL